MKTTFQKYSIAKGDMKMKSLKSSWWAYLVAALGLLVGAVAFHTPNAKAQAGVKVTIEVVKDIRDRTTIQAEGSQIFGFSCANNTSGMGNKCWVASVK
jgi:hypothetical protein